MDANSPPFLIEESVEKAVRETRRFVEGVLSLDSGLVKPVITPRFAPSCSAEMMFQLSLLAREYDIHIQTHLCENEDEIKWVTQDLFPSEASYTAVYDSHGLLTNKTVLAHCIHLSPAELDLIKRRQSAIAHCACSNFALCSGICPIRKLLKFGIDKIGLGSDLSGGYHPGMLEAIRQSITASKVYYMQQKQIHDNHTNLKYQQNKDDVDDVGFDEDGCRPLSVAEGFYLATVGGAKALGIQDKVGHFKVGMSFDACLVRLQQASDKQELNLGGDVMNNIDLWPGDGLQKTFEKFIWLGDDRNFNKVWVNGKLVKDLSK